MDHDDHPVPGQENQCPSLEVLEAMASGTPAVSASDSTHVQSCSRCLHRLDTIRKNNDLLGRLESADSAQAGSRPVGLDASAAGHTDAGGRLVDVVGYEIGTEIHRGGQGVVYRAKQVATNREVAIKVLLAGTFATERQRMRFEREIELAAALRHPNIVTVHDSGRTADGCEFLVMEYVRGRPLDVYAAHISEYGASAPRSRARVCELLSLFEQICRAVTYAHQRGVIHRDLKPANILVDADGAPHVLDFGLAKALDVTAGGGVSGNRRTDDGLGGLHSTLTMPDSFLGTLAYAAPEQVRGDAGAIDVRTDVYAIGVMLYEALTGSLPFAMDRPLPDVLHAIAESDPLPMQRQGGYLIDTELKTIVLKALAKEKGRRYQTADAFRADLSHYIAGEPIDARRDSGLYLFGKTLKRYRWLAGGMAAALVLLSVFAISMSILWQHARVEAAKSNQIRVFLEDTLGSVQPAVPGKPVTVRETLDEAVHWVDIALEGQPEVQASILLTIGNSYRSLGHCDVAAQHVARSLAILERLHGRNDLSTARALSVMGLIRQDQQRLTEAEGYFLEVLDIRKKHLGDDHPDVAMCMSNLGNVRALMHDYVKAEDWYHEVFAIRVNESGYESDGLAMTYYQMAEIRRAMGDPGAARFYHDLALDMRYRVLHEDHPDLARSLLAAGSLARVVGNATWSGTYGPGDPARAAELLRECLEIRRRTLPADHWLIAEVELELGLCLAAQWQDVEAEAMLMHAFGVLYAALGPTDERTVRARDEMVGCYCRAWNFKYEW